MTTRIGISILLCLLAFFTLNAFGAVYSPILGATNASVLNDTVQSYVASNIVANHGIERLILGTFAGLLLLTWVGPLSRLFKRSSQTATVAAVCVLAFTLTSCGPPYVKDVVEVKSNETAWAIPLDGSSKDSQVKFNSVDFLNQRKVPAKRIMIEKIERSTGRMWFDYEWIDATRVITVDRSLVTREWTSDDESGTNHRNEGIDVVTKDSVGLTVGLTITASIDEDDASTYLYYHGSKKLSEVLDQNVRSFAVAELTKEYSLRDLTSAQTAGKEIYDDLFKKAYDSFKPKGVTIQYLGNQGGIVYKDKKVQEAINKRYLAEQEVSIAFQEQQSQNTRNQTMINTAQAKTDAANKLATAKDAVNFQTEQQVKLLAAEAQMEMAKKWSGNLPLNILPANSPLLLNMGNK